MSSHGIARRAEALEPRCLLAASAFSAYEALDQVVAKGLTNAASVDELVDTLTFDDVFQAMSIDETLETLVRQRLTPGFDDVGSLRAEIGRRGIDLSGLRPDGLLTLLSVAPQGSMLDGTPREIRARLAADFDRAPLPLLDAMEPLNLLELFDGQFRTSTADPRSPITAFAWKDVQPGLSNVVNLAHLAYYTVNGQPTLISPAAIVAETNRQPAGEHAMIAFGIQILPGFYEGYIDPVDAQGRRVEYPLPWMDQWADTVGRLMDNYIAEFKRLGGTLDVFLLDMESTAFSMHSLASADADTISTTGQTIWEAIQADSRWPALRAQMERAGIKDFSDFGTWHPDDPRTLIWDSVMEQRRADYLERGLYEPLREYFPDVRFANYGNYYHNQSTPAGSYDIFTETWTSIGTIVGTHQSRALYGERTAVTTPEGVFDDTPNTETAIASIQGVNGIVTVQVYGDLTGLHAGDEFRIFDRCKPYVAEYAGSFVVSRVIDSHTFQYYLPGNHARVELPPNVHCTGVVSTRSSYDGLVHDVKFLRTQISTSDAPLLPWFSAPGWGEFSEGVSYDHWTEAVFHAALSGAQEFAFWNSKGMDANLQGNVQMDRALGELEPLIGFAKQIPLTYSDVDWSDDFLLSGMEAGGRRIYRLTPNPEVSFRVLNASRGELEIDGRKWSLPNSYIQTGGASPLGVWIIQRHDDGLLRYSAATTWNRIWTQPADSRVEVTMPSGVIPGQSYYVSARLSGTAAGQTALFAFDWEGDGKIDTYAYGQGQASASNTLQASQVDRLIVSAFSLQGRKLGVGSTLVDARNVWITTEQGLRTLIIGGTDKTDTILIAEGSHAGEVVVTLSLGSHPPQTMTFTGITGRIIAYGNGGNDHLVAQTGRTRSVELYGGAGDDVLESGAGDDRLYGGQGDDVLLGGQGRDLLQGGGGADVLVGGDGDDELAGGGGRDVVIGGRGSDYLFGGDGDDILIAGTTTWDTNTGALQGIRAEWNSDRSQAQRIANLIGQGTGRRANAEYFFQPGKTLLDDGAIDWLLGNGGVDWFIYRNGYDRLLDPVGSEPRLYL